nr:unnamed protein product [Digitaria exilis]
MTSDLSSTMEMEFALAARPATLELPCGRRGRCVAGTRIPEVVSQVSLRPVRGLEVARPARSLPSSSAPELAPQASPSSRAHGAPHYRRAASQPAVPELGPMLAPRVEVSSGKLIPIAVCRST